MAVLAVLVAQGGSESRDSSGDSLSIPRAEFAKYYREITGKAAPDGMVEFAIDPKVSKSGNDAYTIISVGSRVPRDRATITGSNLRSVLYGVYDLLARRGGYFCCRNAVLHKLCDLCLKLCNPFCQCADIALLRLHFRAKPNQRQLQLNSAVSGARHAVTALADSVQSAQYIRK